VFSPVSRDIGTVTLSLDNGTVEVVAIAPNEAYANDLSGTYSYLDNDTLLFDTEANWGYSPILLNGTYDFTRRGTMLMLSGANLSYQFSSLDAVVAQTPTTTPTVTVTPTPLSTTTPTLTPTSLPTNTPTSEPTPTTTATATPTTQPTPTVDVALQVRKALVGRWHDRGANSYIWQFGRDGTFAMLSPTIKGDVYPGRYELDGTEVWVSVPSFRYEARFPVHIDGDVLRLGDLEADPYVFYRQP
jgi:hypothetical protein